MFRSAQHPDPSPPRSPGSYLKRALLFGSAFLLLWVALQLMPDRPTGPPVPLVAADSTGIQQTATSRSASDPSLLTSGYLLVLALLAGGGAFALFMRRRNQGPASTQALLKTMGHLQIAPNQQLRLVACGGDILLLGVTGEQINLLKTYAPEAFEEPAPAPTSPAIRPAPVRPRAAPVGPAPTRRAAVHPMPPPRPDDSPFLRLLQYYAKRSTDTPTNGAR